MLERVTPNEKCLMAEMTWPELREAIRQGRMAVVPAGMIEQHGPHLPLDTDILLAQEITLRAAAQMPEKLVYRFVKKFTYLARQNSSIDVQPALD
jgi:creatinine amidohydrolase/Fe(II)-dependent formamide hydrolase-like protein